MKTMIRKWESLPESRGIRPCKRKTLYYQQLRRSPLGILSIREKLQLDFALYTEGLVFEPEHKKTNLGAMTMRMQKSSWIAAMAVLVAAVVMGSFSASDALAQKGGGGSPPPAPVNYGLRRFVMPADYVPTVSSEVSVECINNFAEVVGYYDVGVGANNEQPFYYDGQVGGAQATNLNDLIFKTGFAIPADSYILAALAINNSGEIAAALALKSDHDQLRGCVIKMRPPTLAGQPQLPSLHLLPDGQWSHTYARGINDDGTILGRGDATNSYIYRLGNEKVEILPYAFDALDADLNNFFGGRQAQVLSRWPFQLYTLGAAAPQPLSVQPNSLMGLADTGAFCGSRTYANGSRGGFWYDGAVHDVPNFNVCEDINNSHDVAALGWTRKNERLFTLLHANYGALNVDAMIVAQSVAELEIWKSAGLGQMYLSERAAVSADDVVSKFPIIGGRLARSSKFSTTYEGYVLLPIPIAAN